MLIHTFSFIPYNLKRNVLLMVESTLKKLSKFWLSLFSKFSHVYYLQNAKIEIDPSLGIHKDTCSGMHNGIYLL